MISNPCLFRHLQCIIDLDAQLVGEVILYVNGADVPESSRLAAPQHDRRPATRTGSSATLTKCLEGSAASIGRCNT